MSHTLTTSEAASLLKVDERTVRNMITRGSLYAEKIDPRAKSVYRIPMDEIQRLLRERKNTRNLTARKP